MVQCSPPVKALAALDPASRGFGLDWRLDTGRSALKADLREVWRASRLPDCLFLVLRLHGTEIERPLATVMIGGLVTSTLFTLFFLPVFLPTSARMAPA